MNEAYKFEHEAMKTTYTLRLAGVEKPHAKKVALASFQLLDEIEGALNRYLAGSDIWQINHMQPGETLFLTDHAYRCIQLAIEAHAKTKGIFDCTIGTLIEEKKRGSDTQCGVLSGQLRLDPDRPAIHCVEAGREIDLGGIGKGYALDTLLALIKDWGAIEAVCLSAGSSTHLAWGNQAWPLELTGEKFNAQLSIQNQALSTSGTAVQGSHIINPHTRSIESLRRRIWILEQSAAVADAYSTAALCMSDPELTNLVNSGIQVFIETQEGIQPMS